MTGVITLWAEGACRTAENKGERMYQLSSQTVEKKEKEKQTPECARNVAKNAFLKILISSVSPEAVYPSASHYHSSAIQGPCVKGAHDVL